MSTAVFLLAILALVGVRLWAAYSVLTELEGLSPVDRARMQRALSQAV